MAKYKGDWRPKYHDAMESAADEALGKGGPGTYQQALVEIRAHHAEKGEAPGHNPLSDYRITLEGPIA